MFYKINKPTNVFCNKYIRSWAKENNAEKIGQSGTLDPLASGLVIMATNSDTKILQYVKNQPKVYLAKMEFNLFSNTLDSDGEIKKLNYKKVTLQKLEKAIVKIKKQTYQMPPQFSSKKVKGKKALDLAYKNIAIKLKKQKIKIFSFELLEFNFEKQYAIFEVSVSSGTYIRSIAKDLAKYCNSSAILTSLKRKSIDNIFLNDLKENEFEKLNIKNLFNIKMHSLSIEDLNKLKNGQRVFLNYLNEKVFFIVDKNSAKVLATGKIKNKYFYPKNVFVERIKNELQRQV
ncbi:tRNA pseudouridine synthase B [Mycoplasmopsis synoviae]|uniref:tRNA pseudouridine synthase B n=1 Tax=Mycoplasmopsis synoviae TaxID=2109 RepID=UPI0034DB1A91